MKKIAPVITALGAVSAVAVVFLYAPAPTAQPTSCMVALAAERAFPSARRGAGHLDGDGRELRGGSRLPVQRRPSN